MAYSCYTENKDPRTGLYKATPYKSSIEPYKMKTYKPSTYTDPLKSRPPPVHEFKNFKPTVYEPTPYKPFSTIHVYKPPNIDPLTGRPRRPRQQTAPKPEEAPRNAFRKKLKIKPIIFETSEGGDIVRKETQVNDDTNQSTERIDDTSEGNEITNRKRFKKRTVNEHLKLKTLWDERQEKRTRPQPETLEF